MKNGAGRVACALAAGVLCFSSGSAMAQVMQDPGCVLQTPSFIVNQPNIFNDQQEQYLGDALAELEETDLRLLPPAPDDQITRIGEKLLATLPPTGVHYRFRIYDSGEINGFSLAGGRVYISRKLVTAVRNEDELAGVLAHEIGHISTHQVAIKMTRALRIRLGVTQVTDRADVFATIHRFLSTPAKKQEEEDTEKKDQLAADHVALYAMVRAGYAPESFISFLNESMVNKGKKGNWLSDAFGITGESSQRYRTSLKTISVLPEGCKSRQPGDNEAFRKWQKSLVEERTKSVAEGNNGDHPLKLETPLWPSPWRIRFSLDGRYVLVQDDGSIAIVDRLERKALFRIDAPDANAAWFTPDSKSVVFDDSNLRVERWEIATGKRTSVKEVVVFEGCDESLLSPDGNTLVCAKAVEKGGGPQLDVKMIDVETGKTLFEQPKFFHDGEYSYEGLRLAYAIEGVSTAIANLVVSPDGRYVVVTAGTHSMAYDFIARQIVPLGGKLKGMGQVRMTFLGPNEMAVAGPLNDKGLYTLYRLGFPEGHVIREDAIGDQGFNGVTKGSYLVAGPFKDFALGLIDTEQNKLLIKGQFGTMDVWDKYTAGEGSNGGLRIGEIGSTDFMTIPLPLGPLPPGRASSFSPEGKYLAYSLRNRAQIWNLETGKPVKLIRPFRSAWFDRSDELYAFLPKYAEKDETAILLTLDPSATKDFGKYDANTFQYGDLQIHFRPMGKDKQTSRHATLEVKRMGGQTALWSRDYQHEAPVCWSADGDRLTLAWDLSTDGAQAEMRTFPALRSAADSFHNHKKGLLLETITPETGAPLQQVVIPEVDLTKGWNDERFASVFGDYILVHGEHDNTVLYGIDSGAKVGEFFGAPVATDSADGLIAAIHAEDELRLVDEHSGKELRRFTLGSPIRAARIVSGKEKDLLVLTADQVVHRLPLKQ